MDVSPAGGVVVTEEEEVPTFGGCEGSIFPASRGLHSSPIPVTAHP